MSAQDILNDGVIGNFESINLDEIDENLLMKQIDLLSASLNSTINNVGPASLNGYSTNIFVDDTSTLRSEDALLRAEIEALKSELEEERNKVSASELEEAKKALEALT